MSCSRQIPVIASHYRRKGARLSLAAAVAAVLAYQSASATILTWKDSDTSNTWNLTTTTNWVGGVAWNNSTPDEAVFGGTGETVTLGVPIFAAGLTFNSSGYTIGGTNTLTLSGATPTITVTNSADNATISAVIAGTAGLTKAGAGTLTLSGVNSYTGGTIISTGTLLVTKAAALSGYDTTGAVTVNSGATLAVSVGGAGQWVSGDIDTLRSNATFGSNTAALGFNTAGGDFAYASNIAGDLALRKLGANTLTLSGSSSYTGATIINAGVLSVDTLANGGANSSIGASSSAAGNLSLGGGTLRYTGETVTTDRAFTLTAGSGIEVTNAATTLTFDSNITATGGMLLTKTGSGTLALRGTGDNVGLVLSVVSGEVDLGKQPSSGSVHAVAGIASVAAGATVKLTGGGGDQISNGNSANRGVNGLAGTLDLNGNSEDTSFLAGTSTGVVTNSLAASSGTLTVGVNNATSSFTGKIQDGNGTIALVKTGMGTQILGGTNTYTGGTTINAGALQVLTAAALSGYNSPGKVVVNSTGTLIINAGGIGQWASGNVDSLLANATFSSSSALGIDTTGGDFTYGGNVSGVLELKKLGNNILTLTGTNTNTGGTTIGLSGGTNAGTLRLSGSGVISSIAPATVFAGTLDLNGTTQTVTALNLGGGAAGSTAQVLLNGGTLNLGGNLTYTGTNNPNGATISGGTLNLNAARTITVNDSVFASDDLTISSLVANGSTAGKLTKAGTGTLVLTSANTYTAGTDISAGAVALGNDAALGSGVVNFTAANVGIRSSDTATRTIGNTITFSNTAVFGSATTGDLIFTGAINTGNGAGTTKSFIIANGVTQFKGAVTEGPTTPLPINSYLIKDGPGTLIFSGTNTTTKNMTVTAGMLTLDYSTNDTNKLADGAALTLGNGTLNLSNTAGGGAHVEIVANTIVNGSAKITRTSGTNTINLNAITRNVGGTLDVASGVATTDTPNANSILGGWATTNNGTDWAVNSTNGLDGAISGLATYTDDAWAAGNNTNVTLAGANPGGDATTYSLRFNAAGAKTLTLSGTTNTVTSGGILVTPGVGANATTITGSTLVGAAGADLIVHQNNTAGSLTIASVIGDNISATGLTKSGAGTLILTGANTYTGTTAINAGTLQVGNSGTAGALGTGVVINNSSLVFKRSDAVTVSNTISGSGALTQAGSNTLTLGGTSANTYTGKTVVLSGTLSLNKPAGTNAIAGDIDVTGGTLAWGAANQIADTAKITLSGSGSIASVMTDTVGDVSVIGNGGKFNPGSGSNLSVNSLTFTNIANVSPTNIYSLAANSGNSTLTIGVGGWTVNSSNYSIGQAGNNTPTVKLGGNFTGTGTNTIWAGNTLTSIDTRANIDFQGGTRSFDIQSGETTIVPKITNGALTKIGTGTLTLAGAANDYTGATIVSAGSLKVSGSIAGSSQITVQNTGSLVLAGTSSNRIGDTTLFTLGSGSLGVGSPATLQLDNSAGKITETVGTLTLANNSIIDFGTGAAGAEFHFSSLDTWASGATLSIYNWSGNDLGTGIDRLYFDNSSPSLTNQLNAIRFYSDAGNTLIGTAALLPDGQLIAPVPEPTTLASGLVMLGYVFFHRRRAGRWTDMGRRAS